MKISFKLFASILTMTTPLAIVPVTPAMAAEDVYFSEACLVHAASQADRYAEEGLASGQSWTDLFIYFTSGCQPLNQPGKPKGGVSGLQFCSGYSNCDVVYYMGRIPKHDDS